MGKSSTSLFIHHKPLIHLELLFLSSSVVPRLVPRSGTLLDVCIYCHWFEFLKRLISIICCVHTVLLEDFHSSSSVKLFAYL